MEVATKFTTLTKNSYAMHTIKLLLTYYLNISVQAANFYQIAETNRIESKLFCRIALLCNPVHWTPPVRSCADFLPDIPGDVQLRYDGRTDSHHSVCL